MTDIEKANHIFADGEYTLVLVKGDKIFTSKKSGVAPMLGFIESKTDLQDFCASDKIVGKAAAMLFALAGVKTVHAQVLSRAAEETLRHFGIDYSADTVCENIINRRGDDICPMEKAVIDEVDPGQAYDKILKKLEFLRSVKNGN